MDSEQPIPEGLARLAELGKSSANPPNDQKPAQENVSPNLPPAPVSLSSRSAETVTKKDPVQLPQAKKDAPAPFKVQGRAGGGKLADRFNPALAGMLARGPPPMATEGGKAPREASQDAPADTEPTKAGPQLTHMTKGRARGPKRKAPSTATSAQKAPTPAARPEAATASPQFEPAAPALSPVSQDLKEPSKPKAAEANDATNGSSTPPLSIQQQVAAKASLRGKISPPEARNTQVPAKSAVAGSAQSLPFRQQPASPEKEKPRPLSPLKPHKTGGDVSQPGSPRKLDVKRMSKFLDDSSISSPNPEAPKDTWRLSHQRTGSTSPVKRFDTPTSPGKRFDAPTSPVKGFGTPSSPVKREEAPISPVRRFEALGSPPKREETPLASKREAYSPQMRKDEMPSPPAAREQTPRPKNEPSFRSMGQVAPLNLSRNMTEPRKSPSPGPKPLQHTLHSSPGSGPSSPEPMTRSARPLPNPPSRLASPTKVPTPLPSPSKQTTEVSILLTDFFGPDRPSAQCQVDATALITQGPRVDAKVNTLRVRMCQITGDGKKIAVDPQFERTLFEREMYIVGHDFKDDYGRNANETYFWVGDEVPESTIEDGQLFASREARAAGGKLVKVRQGKETVRFLQALGDVIITRRGSSKKFDSLAPCMLCGRRYMGEVVFDEVDFAMGSLCAGFPFVVSKDGNCFVWQGKGSTVDEVSCAKLVGMEITITGDLTALEEGSEPDAFWGLFEAGMKPHSADHWRLKPSYDKYSARLFCSDAESRQQVR